MCPTESGIVARVAHPIRSGITRAVHDAARRRKTPQDAA